MARELIATVYVYPKPGEVVRYNPGDTVPAKHAKLVSNPKCWAADEVAEEPAGGDDSGGAGDQGDQSGAGDQS